MTQRRYRVAVDIGGTFTDLVVLDEHDAAIRALKVSSTKQDPSQAVLTGVRRLRDELGVDLTAVGHFTHASTIGSNCILEARGARTALLTTDGFKDLLEIQRHKRYRLFDLAYQKIKPLAANRHCFGIPGRIDPFGTEIEPLDENALRAALRAIASEGIESLAICFLFSFVNPSHEIRAEQIAQDMLPNVFITRSSEIFPQFREYERASTTVVNAYLGPRVATYLQRMSEELARIGTPVALHLMQSNGGVISWMEASRMPCRVVESGPAAGVIAAAYFGGLAGRTELISFDMGGTTAKAGLIENGQVRQATGQEVGLGVNQSRLLQGGGYYIGAPTIDLAEVGAGGGSIAWLDSGGVLKVGPRSAGADPGPIAYGLGGTNPTVTDANLLLGRIPADSFLGGEMTLDLDAARRGVQELIAGPLNISVDEACAAIIDVANANMLKMLRIVSVEKGCDPADFTMVAFGGNGPVHGAELAHDLGIPEMIAPPVPGVLSAQGLLVAEIRYDFRQTHVAPVAADKLADVERIFADLERKGRDALKRYGLPDDQVTVTRFADMRYPHQGYEMTVELGDGTLTTAIAENFHAAHERRYGRRDAASAVEIVTLHLTAKGESLRPDYKPLPQGTGNAGHAHTGTRPVYFRDVGRVDCDHYDRARLAAGDKLSGPAIVQAVDSTTIVPIGWSLECDRIGNLILTRNLKP